MLSNYPVSAVLPAKDYDRAKKFYGETLGFQVREERGDGTYFDAAEGTGFLVYPTQFAGTAQNTAVAFRVDNIEKVMEDLRGKGIKFEEYDFPGLKTVNGVAELAGDKAAWFKDTEGNIIALGTLPT